MCRCFEEITEPNLKKKVGRNQSILHLPPPRFHFDSLFSMLPERPMSLLPVLTSSCSGPQSTGRRPVSARSGVLRRKASDPRQGCVPCWCGGPPRLASPRWQKEHPWNPGHPDTAQLQSQRCCFQCLSFCLFMSSSCCKPVSHQWGIWEPTMRKCATNVSRPWMEPGSE